MDNPAQEQLKALFADLTANQQPIKIIIGARETKQSGWVATDIDALSLLEPKDWERYFGLGTINAIMAEHVWEHLTEEQGIKAAQICYQYLQVGGYLRLAVPDGLHPRQDYLDWVRPLGNGPDAADHKVLYNFRLLEEVLTAAGFKVELLEYFDEMGNFHYQEWSPEQGLIKRSQRFDPRNNPSFDHNLDHQVPATFAQEYSPQRLVECCQSPRNAYFTSILLDAWKLS